MRCVRMGFVVLFGCFLFYVSAPLTHWSVSMS
jgi:hypothetical protein